MLLLTRCINSEFPDSKYNITKSYFTLRGVRKENKQASCSADFVLNTGLTVKI